MRVLTVAAHPDDEILGCGGTMARLSGIGHDITILIMAEGGTNRGEEKYTDNLIAAGKDAATIVGAQDIIFKGYGDNVMDKYEILDLTQAVEGVIDLLKPEMIFTHSRHDLNIDHRRTFDAVVTACRPVPGQCVKEIYAFEVPSSTEWGVGTFQPTQYWQIEVEAKLLALKAYDAEMRPTPHARSYQAVRALATIRGAHVGLPYAEAFEVVRIVR